MGIFTDDEREAKKYIHENDKQWFGRKKREDPPYIHLDYLMENGIGIWQWDGDLPEESVAFVVEQMVRFGLHVTPGMRAAIEAGMTAAFDYCNVQDPYVLFSRGLSDVSLTDDWSRYTYEITKHSADGKAMRFEPGADSVESYALTISQCEWAFRQFMQSPWLAYAEALHGKGQGRYWEDPDGKYRHDWIVAPHPLNDIASSLQDIVTEWLADDYQYTRRWDEAEYRDARKEIRRACTYTAAGGHDVVDIQRSEFYFEFAAWAAFVWLASPLSHEFRIHHNDLTEAVHEDGEAILADFWVVGKTHYRKMDRPTEACARCHIQAWCLEHSVQDNTVARICESCMSRDMPILPPANCGSRLCKMPQCKHHPYYAFDPNLRLHHTMRNVGYFSRQVEEAKRLAGQSGGQNLLL